MLEPITKQDLLDASRDALTLEQVVNGAPNQIATSRLGRQYPTLATLLNVADMRSFVNRIDHLRYAAPVDQTNYALGTIVNDSHLQSAQVRKYAQFLQKLRTRQQVNIACFGTSITEGHDTVSLNRRFITVNSGVSVAAKTYPEQMQDYLRKTYNTTAINVISRGWSGHTVAQAFNQWTQKPACDFAILEYGANDSSINTPIADFLATYEQLVIRFLSWEIPLIILTPTKPAGADNDSRDSYANASYLLAQKYNIPWVNLELMMKNYGNSVYSDTVHLNGTGYSILGTKIAATLIGEGAHYPKIVSSGSALLSRHMIDNIVYGANATKTLTLSLGQTPNEVSAAGNGIVASIYGQEGEAWVTYSFYAATDNLSIIPNVFVRPNATIQFELDGGFVVAQDSMDLMIDETQAVETGNAIYSFTNSTANPIILSKQNQSTPVIKCVTEGWHTLRVRSLNDHSDLYGLEFINHVDLPTYRNALKIRNVYSLTVGTDNVTTFPTTNILLSDLLSRFDAQFDAFDFWKNPALKVTITAPLHAVDRYTLVIGSRDPNVNDSLRNFRIGKSFERVLVQAGVNTAEIRTLASVSYVYSTDTLTLNWGGSLSRRCNVTITLA